MVEVRPMVEDDVAGAEAVWHAAHSAMRAANHLPAEPRTPETVERLQRRIGHLRSSDPDGSWVAVDGERVVGLAQAFVRDDLWVLSLLGVEPSNQDRHTGRDLLDAALAYGRGAPRGMIMCSRDPRAARRYAMAGFDLHPAVMAYGRVDPRRLPPSLNVRDGSEEDFAFAADLDRVVRGGAHGVDLEHLLADGCRLLVSPGEGYVVAGPRPLFLAATTPDAAADLLFAALSIASPDQDVDVAWITAPQQWAIRAALEAGLQLYSQGPVMLRGFDGPPAPYLPSGGFG